MCVPSLCRASGLDMSQGLTPEVQQFRERSVVDFLGDVTAHVAARGGKNTICLLPLTDGPHGVSDWDSVAALPNLAVLATDPYWKNFAESAESFVGRFARLLAETAGRHDVGAQMWLPSFGLTRTDIPDLEAAVRATRAAGIDDVWTWGYEACAHMTHLATPDSPLVWEAVTAALTGGAAATERQRVDLRDLDLRPTAELVRLINDEDRTVAGAVADAAESIAGAIDAIAERLEARRKARLHRRRIVGSRGGGGCRRVRADLLDRPHRGRNDRRRGGGGRRSRQVHGIFGLRVSPKDIVLAISASGRTPYTLAAVEQASEPARSRSGLRASATPSWLGATELAIEIEVGPEVIAGSTRMKAGTAQKLVLNTISTIAMVRLGKTFGNLMVDVQASNDKLRARARRAVAIATAAPEDEVAEAIAAADGDTKVAIVSLLAGVDAQTASSRLTAAGGVIREAVADVVG